MSEQKKDARPAQKPAEETEAIAGKSGDIGAVQIGDGSVGARASWKEFDERAPILDEDGAPVRAHDDPQAEQDDWLAQVEPQAAASGPAEEPETEGGADAAAQPGAPVEVVPVEDERAARMREMTERALRIKANREEELRRRAEEAERQAAAEAEERRLEEERLAEQQRLEAEERRQEEERLAEQRRLEAEQREMERMERDAFVEQNAIGSLLFGARATMGKHDLKAVERDLRIKARYLQAIEEVDPEQLPSGAYLSGYVRAYAAYLQPHLPMSPDEALRKFERELSQKTGRIVDSSAQGAAAEPAEPPRPSKSAAASAAGYAAAKAGAAKLRASEAEASAMRAVRPEAMERKISPAERLAERAAAAKAQAQARVVASRGPVRKPKPRRYGSMAALGVLGLGLVGVSVGAWSLWRSSQQVEAPAATSTRVYDVLERRNTAIASAEVARPSIDAYTDTGVMTKIYEPPAGAAASDGPISRIDPGTVGAYSDSVKPPVGDAAAGVETALAPGAEGGPVEQEQAQPVEPAYLGPAFAVRAIAETWVQVKTAEGDIVFVGTLTEGEMVDLPVEAGALELRTGNGGGVVVVVEGVAYGPIDRSGVVRTVALTPSPPEGVYPELPEVTDAIAEEARREAAETAAEEKASVASVGPTQAMNDSGQDAGAENPAGETASGEPSRADIEAAAAGSREIAPAAGGDDFLQLFDGAGEREFVTDPAALKGSIMASPPEAALRGGAAATNATERSEAGASDATAPTQLDAARGGAGR